ncbi:PHA/PHB synthase family protein [Desertibaculum subflavum]|uniref:PHA/PHB synthase family protein n=1 Tax=Desertibaculum subflavum TaxID=2268458 RepID=UPI000E65ED6B
MAENGLSDIKLPDPAEFARNMVKIAGHSQQLVLDFLARQSRQPGDPDPLNIGGAFLEMTARMLTSPAKLIEAQLDLLRAYAELWHNATARFVGTATDPVVKPEKGDRRFRDAAWDEIQVFDFIKQSYLLTARWMQKTVQSVEGLDEATAKKVDFYTRQFVDAMAPSNFVLTNPEVLKATFETNGDNLVRGLEAMLQDLDDGKGRLAIKMTDMQAFKVGINVATAPGKVVFRNDILELIQYTPTTPKVYQRPLLIVPPWINKFYILDLREDNSFIRWMVAKGYTVFVISWVNPDAKLAQVSFEDYMARGIVEAIDAVNAATGERELTVIGYCIGGTLMASALAYMAATGDDRVKACTFFAAQVDFSEAGELRVFIDEEQLLYIEELMRERGFLDGNEMSATFNMLRANDLIWSFVVNNYLLGKEPFPFDLLFWNADATRMPAEMHSFYLRNMYQKNLLAEPGGLVMKGVPIDLRKVTIPVYLQASREDHIAPAKSVYKATQLYQGPVRFVLAGSGHIAGVINPPHQGKYQHWINEAKTPPATLEAWTAGAQELAGSWWDDWHRWLSKLSGPKVPARQPGDGKLKVLGDAPGTYVTM